MINNVLSTTLYFFELVNKSLNILYLKTDNGIKLDLSAISNLCYPWLYNSKCSILNY